MKYINDYTYYEVFVSMYLRWIPCGKFKTLLQAKNYIKHRKKGIAFRILRVNTKNQAVYQTVKRIKK